MKLTSKLLPLILLGSISLQVLAQDSIKIIYPEKYRFNPGDNIEWSKPGFDDSDWKEYNLGEFPSDQWRGVGWVRIPVRTDSSLIATPIRNKALFGGSC